MVEGLASEPDGPGSSLEKGGKIPIVHTCRTDERDKGYMNGVVKMAGKLGERIPQNINQYGIDIQDM